MLRFEPQTSLTEEKDVLSKRTRFTRGGFGLLFFTLHIKHRYVSYRSCQRDAQGRLKTHPKSLGTQLEVAMPFAKTWHRRCQSRRVVLWTVLGEIAPAAVA